MALYSSGMYRRRMMRKRRRIYIIAGLLVIAGVIVWVYPSKKPEERADEVAAVVDVEDKTEAEVEIIAAVPAPNLPAIVLAPEAKPNSQAAELITEAMALAAEKPAKIIEARDRLNEVLPMNMSPRQLAFVKEQLSGLVDKWLFSRTIFPQDKLCGSYKVRQGELLSTIGRQFKVPYEILLEINNLKSPEALRAGEVIKVINGPFNARVYSSTFTMDLYLQNTFIRSFPVGLGQPGMETPTGLWMVKPGGKLIRPTWTDPLTGKTYEAEDPDYPLGSRWIGLKGIKGAAKGRTGFAIHGTKDPVQIGTASSQGCIRLHNGSAILMYNLLMSGFSQVEVVE